jgi:predicted cupin superfamily sugar epimerase
MNLRDADQRAADIIAALALEPHPEGGHYREVWRDAPPAGGRGHATTILFLLAAGERSHWHRVDAVEIWLWHGGASLTLRIADDDGERTVILGPDLANGEVLQAVVLAHAWQAATSDGAWSLVGCIVAPAFDFGGFELAPQEWEPTLAATADGSG